MEMEAGLLVHEVVMELFKEGEKELTTMTTYSIKVFVTSEVVAAHSNSTESVKYRYRDCHQAKF